MNNTDEKYRGGMPQVRGWRTSGRATERADSQITDDVSDNISTDVPAIVPAEPEKQLTAVETELVVDGQPVYQIDQTPPEALVIHCGDPRFQTAFRRFITEELGITSYAPVIIGGGVHAFGVQSFLPKNYKILWEQVKFFLKEQKLRQVVIINHEDCKWYEKMQGYEPKIKLPLKGKIDLQTAARTILQDFAGVGVRTFWASLEGNTISFTEVT